MKSFTLALPVAVLASVASASVVPTKSISKRASETCEQYGEITTGNFIVYNDLWGESYASSGSQCTTVDDVSDNSISWSTSWTWAGGSDDVKSYANAEWQFDATELSSITSIPTTWEWSYTGTDIDADVSYDMFLAPSADGTDEYEIMIWLAAYGGAGPISDGSATSVTIGDYSWDLYSGPNGDTTVYSFVASSTITSFCGDILDFYTYLIDNEGVSDSMYLMSIQAGTEPFTGTDAVLTTTAYTVSVE
ncbi:hypothetical protein ASPZODRAFT_64395 [Penicilliopsis zonata CBS 506.65]|uniref:xyloglucan-specific endo-beta-1,4-glucanase n=1 Tax=Penicilliopsis zonata CBS 506.65 TaxID=1073090 RepID=A0A1L9SKY5_9EURO|nr:hypothetical protein ASPZODRAFT_64395 [Penicilliopsis zonata CBS 506.65]OJJ47776.1 hypothetical protein ASPZODRAFT_64395 [Penicilliopsis zonata CBS 506.65]